MALERAGDLRRGGLVLTSPTAPTPGVSFLVVGTPRSGTTLVQRLISELPDVVMPPETHFFDLYVPQALRRGGPPWDAERTLAEVEQWASMAALEGLVVEPARIVERCGGGCDSFSELFVAIVSELVAADDTTLVGEKTPLHLLWWKPIVAAMPWLRFVVVVRDPRDVVASNLASPWAEQLVGPEWGDRRYIGVAERWRSEQDEALALIEELGDRALLLRYEEAVAAPEDARARLAAFLGVATEGSDAAPSREPSYVLPRETWKQAALGPITPSRIGSGTIDLGRARSSLIHLICRRPARTFGYPPAAGTAVAALPALLRDGPGTWRSVRGLRVGLRDAAADRRRVRL